MTSRKSKRSSSDYGSFRQKKAYKSPWNYQGDLFLCWRIACFKERMPIDLARMRRKLMKTSFEIVHIITNRTIML